MTSLPTEVPPFVVLPRIERIPSRQGGEGALPEFVRNGIRPWGGVPVTLPSEVTASLWAVLAANLGFGGWASAVVFEAVSCVGVCRIATWGANAHVLLVLSVLCVVGLAGAAIATRGLTEAGGVRLGVLVLSGLSGAIAVSGAVALVLLALTCAAVALGALLAVVDRF